MGQDSKIAWCSDTFNPWRGCTKVSAGCARCYADRMSVRNPRVLGVWGPNGSRVIAAESYWLQPLKWNNAATLARERRRVFCGSLMDVFEGPETMPGDSIALVSAARRRLFDLIRETPMLDWLLLTKRPQNIMATIPDEWRGEIPCNVWLGSTIENLHCAGDRLNHILKCPAKVRFLSVEPMLGPIYDLLAAIFNATDDRESVARKLIQWVIVGCESGPHRRPMELHWARSLRDQCRRSGIAFFMKQMEVNGKVTDNVDEFPADLRVRQMPEVKP